MGGGRESYRGMRTKNEKSFKKWRMMNSFKEPRGHMRLGMRKSVGIGWKELVEPGF